MGRQAVMVIRILRVVLLIGGVVAVAVGVHEGREAVLILGGALLGVYGGLGS